MQITILDLWPTKKEFDVIIKRLKGYYLREKASSYSSLSNLEGYIYILILESPDFICYKLGCTYNPKHRFKSFRKDNKEVKFKVLKLYKFKSVITAFIIEQKLLKLSKKFKVPYKIKEGSSELRSVNISRKFSNLEEILVIFQKLVFTITLCN